MPLMKGTFLKVWLRRWRRMGSSVIPCGGGCEWALWSSSSMQEEKYSIPRDVPKGHLVVYVGEDYKRYVINIALLKHPLFKALLDQAREEYDFSTAPSKLCIPCHETIFLTVVRCATSAPPRDRRISMCI